MGASKLKTLRVPVWREEQFDRKDKRCYFSHIMHDALYMKFFPDWLGVEKGGAEL
jgi:hypothetical protein